LKILTFSSLFPNARQPSHGIFVENRLRQLLAYSDEIEARVVAPVPWFPFSHPAFGSYANFAGVAAIENRDGIEIRHPRYPVIPKVGMGLAPWLMYRAVRGAVRRLLDQGFDFDLIDAHYFYPDGVAAMWLARDLGRPFTVTGRGTDLNLIPRFAGPRRRIRQVIDSAGHLITVSTALQQPLRDMGAAEERMTMLRNGVDLAFFHPAPDRTALRAALGITRPTLLSVGNLVTLKGHHLVIEAMRELPDSDLVIAGGGEEKDALERLVDQWRLRDRVRFTGRLAQSELRRYYQAADVLVLASSREGWANVLLESMACGTPVVATPVGGTPEVVASPAGGQLTVDRSAAGIVGALRALRASAPDRAATRAYAEGFSWDETSRGQIEIFERVLRDHYGG
jgi:glycosyltransferase involved in cell wall biosynthesis